MPGRRPDPPRSAALGQHGPMKTERYRIRPGAEVVLPDWPANDTDGFDGDKAAAKDLIDEQSAKLFDLQQLLYADNTRKVLVVLQGMDTSGKDGTIKHVFKMVNPLGVKVANFKRPNDVELEHDYLWRVHHNAPGNGDSPSSTAATTRTCWWCGCTTWSPRRSGSSATSTSATSSRCWPTRARSSGSSSSTSLRTSSASACRSGSTSREELEVRARRPGGAQVLGRLHGCLRGGALADLDQGRALVRRPLGPQVVPEPAGVDHPRRDPRVARPELPRARARPRQDRHRRLITTFSRGGTRPSRHRARHRAGGPGARRPRRSGRGPR